MRLWAQVNLLGLALPLVLPTTTWHDIVIWLRFILHTMRTVLHWHCVSFRLCKSNQKLISMEFTSIVIQSKKEKICNEMLTVVGESESKLANQRCIVRINARLLLKGVVAKYLLYFIVRNFVLLFCRLLISNVYLAFVIRTIDAHWQEFFFHNSTSHNVNTIRKGKCFQ